jgi:hypothetical protein
MHTSMHVCKISGCTRHSRPWYIHIWCTFMHIYAYAHICMMNTSEHSFTSLVHTNVAYIYAYYMHT